jgi:arylsulfatase A-like enzyme
MDDNIGLVLQKLDDMGQTNNTIVVFTTDNGAETMTYPDGGITPFRGQKGEAWEGGYRSPMVVRWPGHIKPGQTTNQMFAALDWVPTLVDFAGGPKGDALKKQIEAGSYPSILKTTLDGFDQRDFLEGNTERSARNVFFFYSGADLSAERYQNLKFYYKMSQPGGSGWFLPLVDYHFTMMTDLKRDPFEQNVTPWDSKSVAMTLGGLTPSTAWAYYGFPTLPLGQKLALEHLETYRVFPPLQAPSSYNLNQVEEEIRKGGPSTD